MRKNSHKHLKKHRRHTYDNKSMYPESDAPPTPLPVVGYTEGSNRPLPKIALAAIGLLLIAGAAFAAYYLFGQKGVGTTVPPSQVASTQPVQVEQVKGKVTAFGNSLLTITKDDGQQEIIKISPSTAVLKPKRLNSYASSSIPTELKIGDMVSVQSSKNPQGEEEATIILILNNL